MSQWLGTARDQQRLETDESAIENVESQSRAATIVGPLYEGKRPFLKIPLLEFHKSW